MLGLEEESPDQLFRVETVTTFKLKDGTALEMIDEDTFRNPETGEIFKRETN